MKKLGLILIVGLLTAILAACGGSSLVGRWESDSDGSLEFFSDGTYTSSHPNYYGDYTVDGNRLMIEGVLMPNVTTAFTVKGDTLIMYDDDGDIDGEYKRIR